MKHKAAASVRLIASVCAGLTLLTPVAWSHHSPAMYDLRNVITITGVVTKYHWANPHVYVYVEETASEGKKVEWEVEGFPPGLLRQMGWVKESLRVGDTITIKGARGRNAARHALFPNVITRGERTLFALASATKVGGSSIAAKTDSLSGVWSTPLAAVSLTVSPPASKLTSRGAEALKRYDEKTSPTSTCIPSPAPSWMILPELKRIRIDNDFVYIESETEGVRRTVHMRVASHQGASPSIQGHSIGKWEGKTLVIDTAGFAYHGTGNGGGNGLGAGLPSSTQKHLIERLTPNADGISLTYSYELTDPEFLAVPRTGSLQWTYSPKAKFEIEKCDAEVARRFTQQ